MVLHIDWSSGMFIVELFKIFTTPDSRKSLPWKQTEGEAHMHSTKVQDCWNLGENGLVTFDPPNYHVRVNLKGDNQQKMKADVLRNILRVGVNFYNVVPGGSKIFRLRH